MRYFARLGVCLVVGSLRPIRRHRRIVIGLFCCVLASVIAEGGQALQIKLWCRNAMLSSLNIYHPSNLTAGHRGFCHMCLPLLAQHYKNITGLKVSHFSNNGDNGK